MAPSTPDFFRKRTTSTNSIASISSAKLRSSLASLPSRSSRDRLQSEERATPPLPSGGAASRLSAAPTSVAAVDLFGGAPLSTTTSPVGAQSDPDFGSSYEGPGAFHNITSDRSAQLVPSPAPALPTRPSSSGSSAAAAALPPPPTASTLSRVAQMNSAYHASNAQEGAWLGGAVDHSSLSPHGLSPIHSEPTLAPRREISPTCPTRRSSTPTMPFRTFLAPATSIHPPTTSTRTRSTCPIMTT